jgi:hypothetical protein
MPAGCKLWAFVPTTDIHSKEDGQMKRSWIGAVLVAVMTGAFMVGCCCPGGGGSSSTKTETTINTTTTGQQLIDLQKAYESGAITEKEYNRQKQEILDTSK